MSRRILALLTVRLRAQLGGELIPFAALLSQGALVAALCLIVRAELAPWGYSLFALTAVGALLTLTLLGEFGALLTADPAAEWSETLPARPIERRAAHVGALGVLLASLSIGMLLPAALLAPPELDLLARTSLVLAGLGQALALGAVLLVVQVALGERAEALLLGIQTVLVVLTVSGLLIAPSIAPEVVALEEGTRPWPAWLAAFPPAWYAGVVASAPATAALPTPLLLIAATVLATALLTAVPPAKRSRARRSASLMALALAPLRWLALRCWVRDPERASFVLVHDALPLEREFIVRTYPMVGIPLAFLVVGARGEDGQGLRDLLALLLYTPAVYLPILLAHVPVTGSPEARWLLETAPVGEEDIARGAIKALAVRFLVPLYAVLGALAWVLADGVFALRIALPGALVSLLALRILYPRCVIGLPLSTAPDEVIVHHDWTGLLLGLAGSLTLLALVSQRMLVQPVHTIGLVGLLLALERILGQRAITGTQGLDEDAEGSRAP